MVVHRSLVTRSDRRRTIGVVLTALAISAVNVFANTPLGAAQPGSLPQTSNEPNFTTGLNTQMRTLWRAIASDSPTLGERVFFPREAYLRMKQGQIVNPAADYRDRLIALFALDVSAYHHFLDTRPHVSLLRVLSARADAAWIAPGTCENRIGYWHLPGVRLIFRRGARVESVAVASLISWRGVWYVVHLGPNPRAANVGTVDDFLPRPGTPGPAGGC
ncbi:MAG: hypothetical protein HIU84_02665 [Acidobacteria bacterium]|nr:hypothetical protein [Acidobacteriota bacterium]